MAVGTCRYGLFPLACLVEIGELVSAKYELLTLCSIGVALVVRSVDGFGDATLQRLCQESASLLHSEEQLPSLLGNGVCQMLYGIRTTGDVDQLVEVCLLLQQQLLVAGNTLGKVRRYLVRLIKRGDDDGIDIGNGCRHRLCLRAQQIDIAVEQRLVVLRSIGTHVHLASAVALWLILLHYLGPQQTGSTELGYLHEIVFRHTHIELHALGSLSRFHAGLGEDIQVLSTPGQSIAQLLVDVGTGIVQHHAVDVDTLVTRQLGKSIDKRLGKLQNSRHILAFAHDFADRIEVDATLQLSKRVVLLLEVSHQYLGQLDTMALAGGEVQLYILRQYAIEQRCNELCVDIFAGNSEAQRVDTLVQDVQRLGVGSLGISSIDVLTHKPQVVVFLVSTYERKFAWQRIDSLQVLQVLTAIERLYVKAFIGSPYQAFLEVCPFEVYFNFVKPLLGGWRSKLSKEFLFVV